MSDKLLQGLHILQVILDMALKHGDPDDIAELVDKEIHCVLREAVE